MTVINRKRLIADDGKILIKNNIKATVVDCNEEDVVNWKEIDRD